MNHITGTTRLTGLLGRPVAHSISPLMHNEAFRLLSLDYVYLCFDVGEEELEKAVEGLTECGIRGFNLTMPNKNRIVSMMDSLSDAARLMQAVNTVVVEDGRLAGHNTDGTGYLQAASYAGYDLRGKVITLMGGGGAARSILTQAALDGAAAIHLFIRKTSRFAERTENLASQLRDETSCRICLHDNEDTRALREALAESYILINATSVGMAPDIDSSIIKDPSLFRPSLVVSDVIYNPRTTRLMREAEEAGCPVFNGMYMLLYQGAEAFRLFTGHDMPVDEIRSRFF